MTHKLALFSDNFINQTAVNIGVIDETFTNFRTVIHCGNGLSRL